MALCRLGQLARPMLVALAIAIWVPAAAAEDPLAEALALTNRSVSLGQEGRYTEAAVLLEHALAIREKALGPEHPDVATSLDNLAGLYAVLRRYAEAEPLFKRALESSEKTLGPDHPDVARILDNLGLLYLTQGHYAEAEPLLKRSVAIWEKTLGPDHPTVAMSLDNLAWLYQGQGRNAEAEALSKRILAIREKARSATPATGIAGPAAQPPPPR